MPIDTLPTQRLEQEGVILRSGLTPTDVMHLRGKYTAFDRRASEMAAAWMCRCMKLSLDDFCSAVEELVVSKMFRHLSRVLMENRGDFPAQLKKPEVLDALTDYACRFAMGGRDDPFSTLEIKTRALLVGIGAPTHFYLPGAAELLGTGALSPEHAPTANALGAAVSCVSVEAELDIRPEGEKFYISGSGVKPVYYSDYTKAVEDAKKLAGQLARDGAKRRGALGELDLSVSCEDVNASICGGELTMLVRSRIRARATARLA